MQTDKTLYDAFWGNQQQEYRCILSSVPQGSPMGNLTYVEPANSILAFCNEYIQGVDFCVGVVEALTGNTRRDILERVARKIEVDDMVDAISVHDTSEKDFVAASSIAVTRALSAVVAEEVEARLVKLCDDSIAVRKFDGTDLFRFRPQRTIESLFYEFCQNNLPPGRYDLMMNGYKCTDAVVKGEE